MNKILSRDDLQPIGTILKTHGTNGEMVLHLTRDINIAELRCLFLEIDGLFVPFFTASSRPRGTESELITLDGIADQLSAAKLCGKEVYAMADDPFILATSALEDENAEGFYADDLLGYNVTSTDNLLTGTIEAIDDSTDNCLFMVRTTTERKLVPVPVAEEYIADIDPDRKLIMFDLPQDYLTHF